MIECILWVVITILQIINIVVIAKQYKTINELTAENEELVDDNEWYNSRYKAVARHCGELRDRIDDAKYYLNTKPIKKEHKIELLKLLEDRDSTTITGSSYTLNTKDMNITFGEIKK